MNNKEKLVEELSKQLHETWEATPGNPFLEIPESCLDIIKIMGAEIAAEIEFEIANAIIAKASSMSKGFIDWRGREEDLINAVLGLPPEKRGDPKQFKWSDIQGLT